MPKGSLLQQTRLVFADVRKKANLLSSLLSSPFQIWTGPQSAAATGVVVRSTYEKEYRSSPKIFAMSGLSEVRSLRRGLHKLPSTPSVGRRIAGASLASVSGTRAQSRVPSALCTVVSMPGSNLWHHDACFGKHQHASCHRDDFHSRQKRGAVNANTPSSPNHQGQI